MGDPMAILRPFRALRPRPDEASRVAALPYDVVTVDEARAQAGDNALSFLRVSRPELELAPGTDPYGEEVYERAIQNFARLKAQAFVLEDEPSAYLYRLRHGAHEQTGLAACFSIDDYDRSVIKKHERTRRDKEDDRTRHMIALGAQTGPVFLVYRAAAGIDEVVTRATATRPLFDFDAVDGVRHTIWRVGQPDAGLLVTEFARIPSLYIADGHHRAASAARARRQLGDRVVTRGAGGDAADPSTFLSVAFPHNQVRILPYNRIVKDLGGVDVRAFLRAVGERFEMKSGRAAPDRPGEIAMYVDGAWTALRPRVHIDQSNSDRIKALDVSILQNELLQPVLGIVDVTTDKRIDFIGARGGTSELERLVDSGTAAVAFSLHAVTIADLMAVSDTGAIMPPKSTWFEPKLRDGLLIHLI